MCGETANGDECFSFPLDEVAEMRYHFSLEFWLRFLNYGETLRRLASELALAAENLRNPIRGNFVQGERSELQFYKKFLTLLPF